MARGSASWAWGAIGGLIAATAGSRLPASEVALSALARGATLAALRQRGPLLLGPQDLVILAVRAPALADAARSMAPLIDEAAGGNTLRLGALGELLSQAGSAVAVSERTHCDISLKLWGNMTLSPISAH